MGAIDEKIKATEFSLSTSLTFDDVTGAADKAANGAGNVGTSVKRSGLVDGRRIDYKIVRLGAVGVGKLTVSYAPQGTSAQVTFSVPDYLVSQTTMFFIPIGPKESPALPVARAFSKLLRHSITAGVVPGAKS